MPDQPSSLVKVEIKLLTNDGHPGEWQWMGKLSQDSLTRLCATADTLSDLDTEKELVEQRRIITTGGEK